MNLKNKKVLVTGGAVRIGECICRAFAEEGANVIIHYNKSGSAAQKLFDDMGGIESGHFLTKGDLTSQSYLNELMSTFNDIDIIVNNASIFDNVPIMKENLLSARKQFEINFWTPLTLMQLLKKQKPKNALIINVLDQRIYSVGKNDGSYLLSKKVLAEATSMLALQWAPVIRVNGVAPGVVIPPVLLSNSKMEKSIAAAPLQKTTNIDEIAEACLFIAKNDSITGEIITLDCGMHLVNQ